MKFRKKPVVIEAMQWTGENYDAICQFTGKKLERTKLTFSPMGIFDQLTIPTLEGDHRANVGDWIIKGVKGEFYPIKDDIFILTYERVTDRR